MDDGRSSPSTCWREVYEAMGVEDDQHEHHGDATQCPDCGLVVAREQEHRCPVAEFERREPDEERLSVSSDGGEDG